MGGFFLQTDINGVDHLKVLAGTGRLLERLTFELVLFKQHIEHLVELDQQLQEFLTWVSQKSRAVSASYKSVTVRTFYFDLVMARALDLVL